MQQLDANLAKADEEVNFANYKLASVQHEIKVNRHELRVAQLNLQKSQKLVAERLVSLCTTPPTSTLEVILGAKSLDQILTNIVENAAKYSPDSSPILVRVRQRDHGVVIAVVDKGGGIAADELPLLRTVIETRKDQIAALNWTVRPRFSGGAGAAVIW